MSGFVEIKVVCTACSELETLSWKLHSQDHVRESAVTGIGRVSEETATSTWIWSHRQTSRQIRQTLPSRSETRFPFCVFEQRNEPMALLQPATASDTEIDSAIVACGTGARISIEEDDWEHLET